jgi:hemolysin D
MTAVAKPRLRLVGQPAKPDPIFGARPRHELEFLPAALEVIETPPPPLPRVAALALTALLIAAIGWASFGQVDVVSTAPGRLVPAGGGKVVQPLETGTITAIHVRDGSVVKKGDVLIELEPADTQADVQRLQSELAAAQLEVARLRTVALGEPFRAPSGADPAAARIAERSAQESLEDRNAKVEGLGRQIEQHRAELSSAEAEVDRLAALAPIASHRTQVLQDLTSQGYGSSLQLIDAQEKQQDAIHTLETQRHRIPEIEAQIASTENQRAAASADDAKTNLAALTDAQVKAATVADDLEKARDRLKDRTLTAPVDGVVQELAVHTIGGVVEPGQTLMRVAPSGAGVEVEAKLSNKDIGFVRAGMPAEIKVETFPFTRYGVIHATVTNVSSDAIVETSPQPAPAQGGGSPSAQPEDLHYLVRLSLANATMNVDGRRVSLTPGMMVEAEIKTGKRRVIEFVLSPLAKATGEAGRER